MRFATEGMKEAAESLKAAGVGACIVQSIAGMGSQDSIAAT